MRVFVDTNVIIDVLARREPFYALSRSVLDYCKDGRGNGMVSALTYANVAYVLRKYAGFDQMLSGIRSLHQLLETTPMSDSTVRFAIESGNRDFEDAMQYESALAGRADIIVTRDPDGFVGSEIRVVSPDEFAKTVISQGL